MVGAGGGLSGVLLVIILYFTNGPLGAGYPQKQMICGWFTLGFVHFFSPGVRIQVGKMTCRSESRVLDKTRQNLEKGQLQITILVIVSSPRTASATSLVIGSAV